MRVDCALIDKRGISTRVNSHECFGFLYSSERTYEKFGISEKYLLNEIQYIKYLPMHSDLSDDYIDDYLNVLTNLGIFSIIEHPYGKIDHSNYLKGVYGDLRNEAGQAIVGAFELIRNLYGYPAFVKLVVDAVRAGVDEETALYLSRFFNVSKYDVRPPSADTTANGYTNLILGNEKILHNYNKNKDKYSSWIISNTFEGVYAVYSNKESPTEISISGHAVRALRSRLSWLIDHCSSSQSDLYTLDGMYSATELEFNEFVTLCNKYHETGTL